MTPERVLNCFYKKVNWAQRGHDAQGRLAKSKLAKSGKSKVNTMFCCYLPKACGMRWRKASPRRPPEAKLSRTFRRFWCWSVLDSTGIRNRMKNGAALISRVEPIACRDGERFAC